MVLGADEGEVGVIFARGGGGAKAGEAEVGEGVWVGGWGEAVVVVGEEVAAVAAEE